MPPKAPKNTGTKEKTYSCLLCNKVDNLRMVRCDNCDGWYHYICVGVTSSVAHRDWRCTHCSRLLSSGLLASQQTPCNSKNASVKSKSEGKLDKVHKERRMSLNDGDSRPFVGDLVPRTSSLSLPVTENTPNLLSVVTSRPLPEAHSSQDDLGNDNLEVARDLSNSHTVLPTSVNGEHLGSHEISAPAKDDNQKLDGMFAPKKINKRARSQISKASSSNVRRINLELQLLQEQQSILKQREELLTKQRNLTAHLAEEEDQVLSSDEESEISKVESWLKASYPIQSTSKGAPAAESTNATLLQPPTVPLVNVGTGVSHHDPLLQQILEKLLALEIKTSTQTVNANTTDWIPPGMLTISAKNTAPEKEDASKSKTDSNDVRTITREQVAAHKGI
ncbi:uncharacterized protein LOC129948382 isoform X2 [Eupeodes corollae]|uniref:uncharacterized protein LOC129948382 isoform X2 n=1 Tax=Eupeodes corollae TaxID=290404 RepID=UPI0024932199|nr:uncharacterized protein LOC129948382 isoform X2 [Eupeodes corollae]